jgi:hypothetical protein
VRRKTLVPILMMYVAAALLLPVIPATKMVGAGGHSRRSIVTSLYSVLEPETVSAKDRDDDDRYLSSRDDEKIQKSFTLPAAGHKSLEIDNVWGSIEVIADTTDSEDESSRVERKTGASEEGSDAGRHARRRRVETVREWAIPLSVRRLQAFAR